MNVKRKIWVLTTTNNRQPLGEKSSVSLHESYDEAHQEMRTDMQSVLTARGLTDDDVEFENEIDYAQTKDNQYCWQIEEREV